MLGRDVDRKNIGSQHDGIAAMRHQRYRDITHAAVMQAAFADKVDGFAGEGFLDSLAREFPALRRQHLRHRLAFDGRGAAAVEHPVPEVRVTVAALGVNVGDHRRHVVGDQAEPVALLAQCLLGGLALGDVAQEPGEGPHAARGQRRDHELDRKLGAIGANRMRFRAPQGDARLAALEVALDAATMRFAKARRDDALDHRCADRLGARLAEHRLGRRIELDDAPVTINGDDGIERRIDDRPKRLLALPQRELSRLVLGDVLRDSESAQRSSRRVAHHLVLHMHVADAAVGADDAVVDGERPTFVERSVNGRHHALPILRVRQVDCAGERAVELVASEPMNAQSLVGVGDTVEREVDFPTADVRDALGAREGRVARLAFRNFGGVARRRNGGVHTHAEPRSTLVSAPKAVPRHGNPPCLGYDGFRGHL
jgi:hypothetical protein